MSLSSGAARLGPRLFVAVLFLSLLLGLPASSSAQYGDESHWGVRVSFAPSWEMPESLREVLFDEDEQGTIKGSEFGIGFVRGSMRGGDWGVSYVRKPWDDGSGTTSTGVDCFDPAQTICHRRPSPRSRAVCIWTPSRCTGSPAW
jgi:hypothetical protein